MRGREPLRYAKIKIKSKNINKRKSKKETLA
jgi:hypothetical protein